MVRHGEDPRATLDAGQETSPDNRGCLGTFLVSLGCVSTQCRCMAARRPCRPASRRRPGRPARRPRSTRRASPGRTRRPRRTGRSGCRRWPRPCRRTATPSAAPISCPVIRKPDAMPACSAGMPVIAVADTAAKTRPAPSPATASPAAGRRRTSRPRRRARAAASRRPRRRARWPRSRGPEVSARVGGEVGADDERGGQRQERQPRLEGGVPQRGLHEVRREEHQGHQQAGDAEHHGGAGHQGRDRPGVRVHQGLRGPTLHGHEGDAQGRRDRQPGRVRAESQPWDSAPDRTNIRVPSAPTPATAPGTSSCQPAGLTRLRGRGGRPRPARAPRRGR